MGDPLRAASRALRLGEVDLVHVGEAAHPAELALRVVARAPLHGLDVAVEQLLEAERGAGRARRPRGVGARDLLDRARPRPSRPRARRSARRAPRAPSSGRRAASDGAGRAVHSRESLPARRRAPPPSRAAPARATTRVRSRGSIAAALAGARCGELRVQRLRARRRRAARWMRCAHGRVGRRSQLEVGQGGLEVEAGAADHDRAPARPRARRRSRRGRAAANSPAEKVSRGSTKDSRRCSSWACSAAVAAPVSVSRPR